MKNLAFCLANTFFVLDVAIDYVKRPKQNINLNKKKIKKKDDGWILKCPICNSETSFENREEIDQLRRLKVFQKSKLDFSTAAIVIKPSSWNSLQKLPEEIWIYIFSFCSPQDVLSFSLVSKEWNYFCKNQILWKEFYFLEFAKDEEQVKLLSQQEEPTSFISIEETQTQTMKEGQTKESKDEDDKNSIGDEFEYLIAYKPLPRNEGEDWKQFFFRNMKAKYPERFKNSSPQVKIAFDSQEKKTIQKKVDNTLGYLFLKNEILFFNSSKALDQEFIIFFFTVLQQVQDIGLQLTVG